MHEIIPPNVAALTGALVIWLALGLLLPSLVLWCDANKPDASLTPYFLRRLRWVYRAIPVLQGAWLASAAQSPVAVAACYLLVETLIYEMSSRLLPPPRTPEDAKWETPSFDPRRVLSQIMLMAAGLLATWLLLKLLR